MFEAFIAKEKAFRGKMGIILLCIFVVMVLAIIGLMISEGEEIMGAIVLGLIGLVSLILGIVFITGGIKKSPIASLIEYCDNSANPAQKRAELEQFYISTPMVEGIRVSDQYIIIERNKRLTMFLRTSTVLWIYQHVTRHYSGIIPVGKSYSIMFGLTDGKRYPCSTVGKKATLAMIEHIRIVVPYLIYGYSKEIESDFLYNQQNLVNAVIARRNETLRYMQQ